MRKKIYTIFLLLVLGIQMLPVQQMGKALFCSQFTEELPHSEDVDNFAKKQFKSDFFSPTPVSLVSAHADLCYNHRFMADAIPQNFSGDIHVPPPNC